MKRKRNLKKLKIIVLFTVLSIINSTPAKSEKSKTEETVTKYIFEMEETCNAVTDLESAGWASIATLSELIKLGTSTVPQLIQVFENKEKDWKLRWLIGAEILNNLKDARAVDPLIKALKDENKEIRKAAINALGDIKDKRAVEPLIGALKDENKDVRMFVPASLVTVGDIRAVGPLITALKDKYWYVRINSARALGNLGDKTAAEPLIEALKNENDIIQVKSEDSPTLEVENEIVRMIIVEAIGKLQDERAIEPLVNTIKNDKSGMVRVTAAKALGVLVGDEQLPYSKEGGKKSQASFLSAKPVSDPRIAEVLIEALKGKDELLQMYAAKSLVMIGAKNAKKLIEETLENVKDEYVRKNMEMILMSFP